MTPPQVLFFDAAGTLFHVQGSVADIYLSYAVKYGVPHTDDMREKVRQAFARAFRDAPPPVFAANEPEALKRSERLWWFDVVHNVFYRIGMFERFDDYFDEIFEAFAGPKHWMMYPDTRETLLRLKEQGFELGIVSNFDTRLFSVLRGLDLTDCFETVTISSMVHSAKPSPVIFRAALDKHAVDPEDAWHIGDSVRDDVEGAQKAGLHAVLLDREDHSTGPSEVPRTYPVIRSLGELLPLLS